MTEESGGALVHLTVSEPLPLEVPAGDARAITARASCPDGRDRTGMAIAVVATLFVPGVRVTPTLIAALVIGLVAGLWPARTVPMTDMPQMVAFLNGLGGGAAALVATAEFARRFTYSNPIAEILGERFGGSTPPVPEMFGAVIGAISFSGSAIAFAKLQGLISERATTAGIVRVANFALAALIAAAAVGLLNGGHMPWFLLLLFAAGALHRKQVSRIHGPCALPRPARRASPLRVGSRRGGRVPPRQARRRRRARPRWARDRACRPGTTSARRRRTR